MDQLDQAKKSMDKAKFDLISKSSDCVFISTILFSLITKWDESFPTAYTDGTRIVYNPEFFNSLTNKQRVFLIVHEAWHVAFKHISRRGTRDPFIWNAAADYCINLMMHKAGFEMPPQGLIDKRFDGMATEQIYDILIQEDFSQPNPQDGDFVEADPKDLEELEKQIDDMLIKATVAAQLEKQAGSIPKEIADYVEALTNPKLPWYQILHNYFFSRNKDDYSWTRPNRRYQDTYMPSLYSEGCGDIFIFPDTSGSISNEQFFQFMTEVKGILNIARPTKTEVVCFDHRLYEPQVFSQGEDITKAVRKGQGGTSFDAPLSYINKHKPEVAIIFTDGFSSISEPCPRSTILIWIVTGQPNFKPPYGRTIHMDG
jgi:predicted metal-dependent peptidase